MKTHKPAFHRIAIVNRGEAAVRFLHAAQEVRHESGADLTIIALYTKPDSASLYVQEADERHCLGDAMFVDPADGQTKSRYLDLDGLEKALAATRADAVWVGWGFVAERPEFADMCERLGLTFIGPTAAVMRKLGDKIESKRLAEQAKVPVAPWSNGPVESLQEARDYAQRLGFPLMIKATAGGGGRGIRSVRRMDQLEEAFTRARAEAEKSFGDATVFMEKRVDGARHVEVQIVADHHGNTWAVGVRDCSIQRRNQKVIEEAPSPALDENQERELREASARLAKEAGYRNAGTVEFLYQPEERAFYFMEMNTRLQVEHPVTELTTGLDLVKMQIAVASGQRLEGDPPPTVGCAIEVRVNAEDPSNDFAPAPGTVARFRLPTGPGIRIDTGVRQGDAVPPDFDSMVAKFIAFGRNRDEALSRLERALLESTLVIEGGSTNKAFLRELVAHDDVINSNVNIAWLDQKGANLTPTPRPLAHIALIQAAIDVYERDFQLEKQRFITSAARGRPTVDSSVGRQVDLRCGGQSYEMHVRAIGRDTYRVLIDDATLDAQVDRQGEYESWLTCCGRRHHVVSVVDGVHHRIELDGSPYKIAEDEGGVVRAPSPGVTLAVNCKVGDRVQQGDRLVVLEAMKMEMGVAAPCGGRVKEVRVIPNTQVSPGTAMVLIEPQGDSIYPPTTPRVKFPALPAVEQLPIDEQCHRSLRELHHAVLGFDLTPEETARVSTLRQEACPQLDVHDQTMWDLENKVLEAFGDIESLFVRGDAPGIAQPLSQLESFRTYLIDIGGEGDGLPEEFVQRLEHALAHFGVTSLTPSPALESALMFIHKASQRYGSIQKHVFGILQRKMSHVESLRPMVDEHFSRILDRFVFATLNRHPALYDLAREARYQFFDRQVYEQAREKLIARALEQFDDAVEAPDTAQRQVYLFQMVTSPQPLLGALAHHFADEDPRSRALATEVITRRIYRRREVTDLHIETPRERAVVVAKFQGRKAMQQVVVSHANTEQLDEALADIETVCERVANGTDIWVDVLIASESIPSSAEATKLIESALRDWHVPTQVSAVIVAWASTTKRTTRYFPFKRTDGGFVEDKIHRGLHPMIAERLELCRLRKFELEQLRARDDVYLYHAVAKDNPKDERLFAFVEIRDLTAIRDENGRIVQLPHAERMISEAMAGVRDFQARRPLRQRLHWNRLIMYVWPQKPLGIRDVMRAAERIAPMAKGLGFEKAVVRIRMPDPKTGQVEDRILHISTRVGTGLNIQIDTPSEEPIRTIGSYDQKVLRMRRFGLVYPYEIIRMLTRDRDTFKGEFPAGTFVEHDLDDSLDKIVPVDRPAGQNKANVVVGVIENYTDKYPEGMKRVMILGDPSREMGALAEPECRRVIAALDLAERLNVPVEWFSVSSGAKISMDVGTEGLDWVAKVIRRIVLFTQAGGEINVIVPGVNVGGQSYWNAEATMLMHTKGILIMTEGGSMVLTGKRALDYSGGVSAEDNLGIGGADRIMAPNGQAQYVASNIADACHILFKHYEFSYVHPGEVFPRRRVGEDPVDRDISLHSHPTLDGTTFTSVGDVFSSEKNKERKKPFDIRSVLGAVIDQGQDPLERWSLMRHAENAVVWDAYLGGIPIELIGIESRPVRRVGPVPGDGPDTWTGGTLFPQSSKKIARAINAASDSRPAVILANLSGFDGSPESMRKLQLEYGSEIGRAVVNFRGPIAFCVISRYHGGAYVVFSRHLNPNLEASALEGSYASVIGGAPAAAVVFPREVKARALADGRVVELQKRLKAAKNGELVRLRAEYDELYRQVYAEMQGQVAEQFDGIHDIRRAKKVGSLQHIVPVSHLRPYLIEAVERGMTRWEKLVRPAGRTLESSVSAASVD